MIRRATQEDISQLVHIDRSAASDHELEGYAPPSYKRIFTDEKRLRAAWAGNSVDGLSVYVFEEEQHVLGFILIRIDANAVELDNIIIAPEHQRKGIGKEMVEFVENLAMDLKKKYVTLGTTRNTRTGIPWRSYSFWIKQEYTVEKEIETEEGRSYGFTEIRFRKTVG